MNCKRESYAKTSPNAIRSNSNFLAALNSFGIDIDFYEQLFNEFSMPLKIHLNPSGIDFILDDINYVSFYHLFTSQADFKMKLQEKIDSGLIQEVFVNNNKRYDIVTNINNLSSQFSSCQSFHSIFDVFMRFFSRY